MYECIVHPWHNGKAPYSFEYCLPLGKNEAECRANDNALLRAFGESNTNEFTADFITRMWAAKINRLTFDLSKWVAGKLVGYHPCAIVTCDNYWWVKLARSDGCVLDGSLIPSTDIDESIDPDVREFLCNFLRLDGLPPYQIGARGQLTYLTRAEWCGGAKVGDWVNSVFVFWSANGDGIVYHNRDHRFGHWHATAIAYDGEELVKPLHCEDVKAFIAKELELGL